MKKIYLRYLLGFLGVTTLVMVISKFFFGIKFKNYDYYLLILLPLMILLINLISKKK